MFIPTPLIFRYHLPLRNGGRFEDLQLIKKSTLGVTGIGETVYLALGRVACRFDRDSIHYKRVNDIGIVSGPCGGLSCDFHVPNVPRVWRNVRHAP